MLHPLRLATLLVTSSVLLASSSALLAQNLRRPVITEKVSDAKLATLPGNVRSVALDPANDQGAVDDALPLDDLLLQLKRSDAAEAALTAYIDTLNDANSPHYHQWLTAEALGQQYGPAESDIAAVTEWLTSQGFTVNRLYPNGMVIDFSGTAREVNAAFHANLHQLQVNGEPHIANMRDPEIPAALVGVVAGVGSLNDFHPRAMHTNRTASHIDVHTGTQTGATPNYTFGSGSGTYEAVVPGDLAIIYNLNDSFYSGFSGQGQRIAVIEDRNVYSAADWVTFRNTFNLSGFSSGTFTQVHPGKNCKDPGVNGDDGEAILDAEWASAAAPSAAIVLASCADTRTTFGGLIALNNLLSEAHPPKIVSISYGESESENGSSANATYYSAYQTAVVEGVSVFVSSGDEGAASSDANASHAKHGIAVSGLASTPYNVAVGGTDFGDTLAGTNGLYWNATNSSSNTSYVYSSAKSYIPEIPWNDSCASSLLASAFGYSSTYGINGFCNSTIGQSFLTTAAGSGGPSGCATGLPTIKGVVSGTCKGYTKPSWQKGVGVPQDGVRDLPDVSLFAANGLYGHYYVFCDTDISNGGASCSGPPSTWAGAGGTSFASPIMAGIQSLVNQVTGSAWGNPNPTYYNLAAAEYGPEGSSSCNSTNGSGVARSCVFYDVTAGDNDVVCKGSYNCYRPSGTYGVLSTTNTNYLKAYGTGIGWDFATGIGSLNANNLILYWNFVSH